MQPRGTLHWPVQLIRQQVQNGLTQTQICRLLKEKKIDQTPTRKRVEGGIRGDNRLVNLVLFSRNSEHLRHELKGRCPNWTIKGKRKLARLWSADHMASMRNTPGSRAYRPR